MKKILCYGDSNTFGYNPIDNSRFDENTRWTALLQKSLGSDYEVIEEGGCDRTGFVDNDKGILFSAQKHFPKIIEKRKNLDILILAIGTNDLQFKYNITFDQIEKGLENLILTAKKYAEKIILIPSVVLSEDVLKGFFKCQFDETSVSKSQKACDIYRKISNLYGLELVDLNETVKPSKFDGLHYDEAGHKMIAEKLAEFIQIYFS